MRKMLAVLLVLSLALGLVGCASKEEKEAAQAVSVQIEKLTAVTVEDAAVQEAQAAYDALTDKARECVKNYSVLETARADLVAIVTGMITDIGTVTLDSKDPIAAARAAYDSLPDDLQDLVENYADLEAAAAELAIIEQADAVTNMIADIGTVTLDSEEAIDAAQDAYNNLPDEAKELVENYADLEAAVPALVEVFTEELHNLNVAVLEINAAMENYDIATMAVLLEENLPIAEKIAKSRFFVYEGDIVTIIKDTQDLIKQVCYPNTHIITLDSYIKLRDVRNATADISEDRNVATDSDTGMEFLRYPFNSKNEMSNAFRAYQTYLNTYFELVDEEISPASSTYFYGMLITIGYSKYSYVDDMGRDFYVKWEYNDVDHSLLACYIDVGFAPEVGLSDSFGG